MQRPITLVHEDDLFAQGTFIEACDDIHQRMYLSTHRRGDIVQVGRPVVMRNSALRELAVQILLHVPPEPLDALEPQRIRMLETVALHDARQAN